MGTRQTSEKNVLCVFVSANHRSLDASERFDLRRLVAQCHLQHNPG